MAMRGERRDTAAAVAAAASAEMEGGSRLALQLYSSHWMCTLAAGALRMGPAALHTGESAQAGCRQDPNRGRCTPCS